MKLLTLAACAALQVLPPLVLYCQVAPASTPETLTVPTLLMPSLALAPVSVARANVGAAVMVSTVMAAALLDGVTVTLLAASVCLTWMAPAAYVVLAPSVKLVVLAA